MLRRVRDVYVAATLSAIRLTRHELREDDDELCRYAAEAHCRHAVTIRNIADCHATAYVTPRI